MKTTSLIKKLNDARKSFQRNKSRANKALLDEILSRFSVEELLEQATSKELEWIIEALKLDSSQKLPSSRKISDKLHSAGGTFLGSKLKEGKEVYYEKMVKGVAKKLKLKLNSDGMLIQHEVEILNKNFEYAFKSMSSDEQKNVIKKFKEEAKKHGKSFGKELTSATVMTALRTYGFSPYLLTTVTIKVISNLLGVVPKFGVYAFTTWGLSKIIGPVGWGLLVLSVTKKLTDPNYKKIMPSVCVIALIRQRLKYKKSAR